MLPVIEEKLKSGGEVLIPITGSSMMPMLKSGRDYAVLKSAPKKLNVNDIPLYRRTDGHFVLHRVIGEDENGYIMRGDNQSVKEYGIKDEQIIGVLASVERNGKRISADSLRFKPNITFQKQILFIRGKMNGAKERIKRNGEKK